jgi:hypothetical protein
MVMYDFKNRYTPVDEFIRAVQCGSLQDSFGETLRIKCTVYDYEKVLEMRYFNRCTDSIWIRFDDLPAKGIDGRIINGTASYELQYTASEKISKVCKKLAA